MMVEKSTAVEHKTSRLSVGRPNICAAVCLRYLWYINSDEVIEPWSAMMTRPRVFRLTAKRIKQIA